jgi:hypothetical protein
MPTLKRPEFLALSLEKLAFTPESNSLDVRIFLDTASDERLRETEYVRDTYLPTAEIFRAGEHIPVLSGCWNILQALKAGYETGAELVYLIEEDVLVRPNFFQWHEQTHASGDYFVTCGRRLNRMPLDFYSNPGTCYRRGAFSQVIPHIKEDFFKDPGGYLKKMFPKMDGMDGPLDDGLIRKVCRSVGGKVTSAEPNVAVHQGFHYYNLIDPYKNTGANIQERIEKLQELLSTVKRTDRYAGDFEPY